MRSQRTLLSPFIKEADPGTKACRVTSWNTNHAKRPYANEAFKKILQKLLPETKYPQLKELALHERLLRPEFTS
jgi:hypothetical protein